MLKIWVLIQYKLQKNIPIYLFWSLSLIIVNLNFKVSISFARRWTFGSVKSVLFWHKRTISVPGIIIRNHKCTLMMRTSIKLVTKQIYNFGILLRITIPGALIPHFCPNSTLLCDWRNGYNFTLRIWSDRTHYKHEKAN